MTGPGNKLIKNKIAHNAFSLYVVQASRKLVPLVTLPYLARVLGPAGWGHVAYALSMGDLIALVTEFGFLLSTTREIAQCRSSDKDCSLIASGTLGAQALLAIASTLFAWLISTRISLFREHPQLLYAGFLYGVAQGISPNWLFQGLERMTVAAIFEAVAKIAGLVSILLFVHVPGDSWKVLISYSLAPVIACIYGFYMLSHLLTVRMPTFAMIWKALKGGWPMFVLRGGMASYATANVLILALFASPGVVGYFASAEKISKAIAGLLMPIRDAFYPRLSHLAAHSPQDSERLTRISALIECCCGVFLTVMTFLCAGFIVRTLFGTSFQGAIPILRILAVLPFILSLTDAIGFQSLLPAGKESLLTAVIVAGGIINCVLAFILAPRFKANGMAVSVLVAEASVCAILIVVVLRTTKLFQRQSIEQFDAVV